ncbi:MAG: T9SS type A sorting domain-containing protein [Crocinitomicaceae bacterium]|nr:T9SS type A sorting domain-containing protein [Crocinitomicaceae bacterium]
MHSFNRFVILLVVILVGVQLNAQVTITVPNPSFERLNGGTGSVSGATYNYWQWYRCGTGTPDIMYGDGLWGVNKASNHLDYYAFMLFATNSVPATESISADLSTPFIAGQAYDFSIDLSSMKRGNGACAINGNSYEKQYCDVELELFGTNACGMDELLWDSGAIPHCDWQQYSGTVTPSSAYTQIQWRIKWIDVYALGLPSGWQRLYAVGLDDMSAFVPSNPLPVELSSFEVQCNQDRPILTWATESELNNDYFEIEFTEDGISYESIGIVDGLGNSTVLQSYQFTVDNRYNKGYFRLKQVDFDGAIEYSKVIMAHCNLNATFVYLNDEDIVISSDEMISEIQVFDMSGKVLYCGTEHNISTTDFSKGVYFVNVSTISGIKSFRIMI